MLFALTWAFATDLLADADTAVLQIDLPSARLQMTSSEIPADVQPCSGRVLSTNGVATFEPVDCEAASQMAAAVASWELVATTPLADGSEFFRITVRNDRVLVGLPPHRYARLPNGWQVVGTQPRCPSVPSAAAVGVVDDPDLRPTCEVTITIEAGGDVRFGPVTGCPEDRHEQAFQRATEDRGRWCPSGPDGWPVEHTTSQRFTW